MDGNQEALNGTRLCCSGGSRGGFWGGCPPLFLDQTEAQRAKKKLGGGDWTLPPYFKVWIWHCVASVEEDKVAEHLMPFLIKK